MPVKRHGTSGLHRRTSTFDQSFCCGSSLFCIGSNSFCIHCNSFCIHCNSFCIRCRMIAFLRGTPIKDGFGDEGVEVRGFWSLPVWLIDG